MPALLLVLFLATTTVAIWHRAPAIGARGAFLCAMIAFGVIVLVSTELLSLGRQLTAQAVAALWLMASLVSIAVIVAQFRQRPFARIGPLKVSDPVVVFLNAATILILGLLGVLAVLEPPNAVDGLIYHLPRLMHWQQNQSVEFYPTHVLRQLHMPPLAEYVLLHVSLLSGTTDLSNLVQWLCLVGSVLGVSLIAAQFGSTTRGQALAALLCATLPIAVVQAYGPKNDVVTAFWFVCLGYLLVRLRERLTLAGTLAAGAALGLALATKGSSAVIAAGPLAVFGLAMLAAHRRRPWPTVGAFLLIGVMGVAFAAPHALRNVHLYDSPIGPGMDGPTQNFTYSNRAFGARELASNLVRNIVIQLSTPWLPVNEVMIAGVVQFHSAMGMVTDEAAITFGNQPFNTIRRRIQDELVANPIHTLLIIGTSVVLALRWSRQSPTVRLFATGLVLAFTLFSAAFAWQVSTTRFQLPLLMLWCPLVGLTFQSLRKQVAACLVLLLFLGAAYVLAENRPRPLVGPYSLWSLGRLRTAIGDRYPLHDDYISAGSFVGSRECAQVGLQLTWDDIEQPWWFLIPGVSGPGGCVEHTGVTNISATRPYPLAAEFQPCAIVNTEDRPAQELVFGGVSFDPAWTSDSATVYLPRGTTDVQVLPYSVHFQSTAPREWQVNDSRRYVVTLVNQGTRALIGAQTRLSVQFSVDADEVSPRWWPDHQVRLSRDVAPGESLTMNVEVKAPETPGDALLRHRLIENREFWFGDSETIRVNVRPRRGGNS